MILGISQSSISTRDRIAELERENERLRTAAPVTAQTIAPRTRAARPRRAATGTAAAAAAVPMPMLMRAEVPMRRRGRERRKGAQRRR